MSKPIQDIRLRILQSAEKEFLEKGFIQANLRNICKDAGVTTGALYNRFENKDELFRELVSDTLLAINDRFKVGEKEAKDRLDAGNYNITWTGSNNSLGAIIDLMYDNFTGFKLLLTCSEGSNYSEFFHDFLEENTNAVWIYFTQNKSEKIKLLIDKDELHLLFTTFWSGIFEVIKHDFEKEKALNYCKVLVTLYNWNAVFEQII